MNSTDSLGSQSAQGIGIITDLDSKHPACVHLKVCEEGRSERSEPMSQSGQVLAVQT